jgi:hypothetical protein
MLMKNGRPIIWLVMVAAVGSVGLIAPGAFAYVEGYAGSSEGNATVEGVITFAGTPPPPKLFPLRKFPNSEYCSKMDSDGKGNRVVRDVVVSDGMLQDVVVYIRDVPHGKAFKFHGTDVNANGCRFLIQGPSTFAGVVVRGNELRVLNEDIDPQDPKAATGVLHNPHGHEARGRSMWTLLNRPLWEKGQTMTILVLPKSVESIVVVQCDQHLYESAYFLQVENPYYAIVGPEGTYAIDRVPKGRFEMIAWHLTLGMQSRTVEVRESGKVTVNFEFSGR